MAWFFPTGRFPEDGNPFQKELAINSQAESRDGMVWLKPAFLEQEPAVSLLLHLVKSVLLIGWIPGVVAIHSLCV